ncbi:MAG: peptidoglycan DD-metalloendopeptidase family protein [Rhizobiaceae bacterium]
MFQLRAGVVMVSVNKDKRGQAVLRGAALLLLGGLASGCSSGVSRFVDKADSFVTGSTANQRAIIHPPANQPYPGDVAPVVDQAYTGSVNRSAVTPVNLQKAAVTRAALPPVAGAAVAPAGAAPLAASRLPTVDSIKSGVKARVAALKSSREPLAASAREAAVEKAAAEVDKSIVTGTTAKAAAPLAEAAERGWTRAGGTQVTLREGETIYNLSRRFGVPANAIMSANGIKNASQVSAGQKLVIPTYVYSSSAPISAPDANPDVAAAKSSRGIKAPVDLPAPDKAPVKDAAAVLPETPRSRDKAAVVAAKTSKEGAEKAAAAKAPAAKASKATGIDDGYAVQSGDSLWSIAKKTGSTTEAIKAANNLQGGVLKIGQKLVIPKQSAAAAQVDPIVTGAAGPAKSAEAKKPAAEKSAKADRLPTYTPPAKGASSKAIEQAEKEVAAAAPEATGIGKMRWPVRGKVLAAKGKADGIDIAVPAGTPVKAAENGVVIYAGDGLKEYGNTVLVRHENGLVTVYGHNENIKVSRGDKVIRGQEIARSGMSGNAASPKLHFEVRKNSTPVDPGAYLE